MLKSLSRLGAAFITAITLSAPAAASTFSIDYTDLWGGGSPAPTKKRSASPSMSSGVNLS